MARLSPVLWIIALLYGEILVMYCFFEMQSYLTDVWGLTFTHAAGILNIWGGLCLILPVFFLYLDHQYLGRFNMLVVGSIAYTAGIICVWLSSLGVFRICEQYTVYCIGQTQRSLFYVGMSLVAVGMSGYRISLRPFIEDNDDMESGPHNHVLTVILTIISVLIGAVALPYIARWVFRFGIPAICCAFGMLLFLSARPSYKRNGPPGSPLTNVFRVFMLSAWKMNKPFQRDSIYHKRPQQQLRFSLSLRCLEKAANIDERNKLWVCSIEEVEEAKIVLRMVPMWMTFVTCGSVASLANTYFVEQANHMSRQIGNWNVPLQILLLFTIYVKVIPRKMAGRLFRDAPAEGTRPVVGIMMSMILSILCCITAARIENWRLHMIRAGDDDRMMSVYWLLFQFFLLAGIDVFLEKSTGVFYRNQAPMSMRVYLEHFSRAMYGLGFILNVLMVYVVGQIRENWFQSTSNRSRLDKYYWLMAALSSINLVVFILVACHYRYRNLEAPPTEEEGIPEA